MASKDLDRSQKIGEHIEQEDILVEAELWSIPEGLEEIQQQRFNHQLITTIMKSVIAMSLLAGLAAASPTISKRAEFCGQWDSEVAGDYTVYNNLWGKDSANSGSQCTTNNGLGSDGSLSWSTSWTWAGGSTSVKSYANVVVKSDKKALSAVSSIPSRWSWR